MKRWDGLVERYVSACAARGLSEGTLWHRRRELERFGTWLKRRRPRLRVEQIDGALVLAYLRARTAFRSKSTVAGTVSTLRGMGEFLVSEGLWLTSPLRWIRGPRIDPRARVPRRIGAAEMEKLWAATASHRGVYHRHLWTAVLSVLYGTGARRGELERLELSSWNAEARLLELDGRKTGSPRQAPVPELTARCLEAYLPVRQHQLARTGWPEETALFVNGRGAPLTGSAISGALSRLAARAGLGGVTVHAFRHSCASDLLEAGVRVSEVQQILGHRVVSTTVRYLQVADPARHAAVMRHPLNDWLSGEAA